ncbi:cohesin [Ordospora colligata]|nr:cohesin [Ordospora colligata]TBU19021.1 cohesin [Ordospora colligata]
MDKENGSDNMADSMACEQSNNSALQGCPLDVFTPDVLINRLKAMDDCTDEITRIINATYISHAKIKKLCRIVNSVSNYSTSSIIEMTKDKNRATRYVSTYLMLIRIHRLIVEGKCFGIVEEMYDEVFLVRFRDVDPNIRTLCVEWMYEWVLSAPSVFASAHYLKYLGWALSDKNDMVRRRGVRLITKLVEKNIDVCQLVSRFKDRIVEIALDDKNPGLKNDGRMLCMILYVHGMLLKTDMLRILAVVDECNEGEVLKKVITKIMNEETSEIIKECQLSNYKGVHELLCNASIFVCSCIAHTPEDVDIFSSFVLDFLRRRSVCCESRVLCYLKMLKVLSNEVTDVEKHCEMLDVTKDNEENLIEVIESLTLMDTGVFSKRPDVTDKILVKARELCVRYASERIICAFVDLLKKLESVFYSLVWQSVELLRQEGTMFMRCLIRSFDVSTYIDNEYSTEIKCYAALWNIMSEDGIKIEQYELRDVSNSDVLCDFLIFFKQRCAELGVLGMEAECIGKGRWLKSIYSKLSILLNTESKNIFVDKQSCISLFKLIEEELLIDHCDIFFEVCDAELVSEFLNRSKSRGNLVSGYFKYLARVEEGNQISSVGKMVASKCAALKKGADRDKVVFRGMRILVDMKREFLYDTILVYFVPYLSSNECIVIEQCIGKSRLKMSLLKRSKSR